MKLIKILAVKSLLLLVSSIIPLHAMEPAHQPDCQNVKDLRFYLLHADISKGLRRKTINNTYAMRNPIVDDASYNVVFTVGDNLTQEDFNEVQNYMGTANFSWWVSDQQSTVHALLEEQIGPVTSEPVYAMSVDLKTYNFEKIQNMLSNEYHQQNSKIIFKKATLEDDLLEWIKISAQNFDVDLEDHEKYIQQFLDNADEKRFSFYIGYFEGIPVATGYMIEHKDAQIATLHLVSTIQPCNDELVIQENILITLLSLRAIADAQSIGCSRILVVSSPSDRSLYEFLGFKECCVYTIYAPGRPKQSAADESDKDKVCKRLSYNKEDDSYSLKLRKGDTKVLQEEVLSEDEHIHVLGVKPKYYQEVGFHGYSSESDENQASDEDQTPDISIGNTTPNNSDESDEDDSRVLSKEDEKKSDSNVPNYDALRCKQPEDLVFSELEYDEAAELFAFTATKAPRSSMEQENVQEIQVAVKVVTQSSEVDLAQLHDEHDSDLDIPHDFVPHVAIYDGYDGPEIKLKYYEDSGHYGFSLEDVGNQAPATTPQDTTADDSDEYVEKEYTGKKFSDLQYDTKAGVFHFTSIKEDVATIQPDVDKGQPEDQHKSSEKSPTTQNTTPDDNDDYVEEEYIEFDLSQQTPDTNQQTPAPNASQRSWPWSWLG